VFGPLPCGGVCIPFSVPEAQDMLIYLCEEIFGFDGSGGEWWEGIGIKGNIVLVGVHMEWVCTRYSMGGHSFNYSERKVGCGAVTLCGA